MNSTVRARALLIAMLVFLAVPMLASAQDAPERPVVPQDPGAEEQHDGWSGWSGRYRITPNDVLEFKFLHVPEFDQEVTVHPDGYVTLRGIGDVRVQGRTLPELQQQLRESYEPIMRDPEFTIV